MKKHRRGKEQPVQKQKESIAFHVKIKGGGIEAEKAFSRTWWVLVLGKMIKVQTHSSDDITLNFDETQNVWVLEQALCNAPAGAAIEEIYIDLVSEERRRGYRLHLYCTDDSEKPKLIGSADQSLRLYGNGLYFDTEMHPAWTIEYDDAQGWTWQKQRQEHTERSTVENNENMHFVLIKTEPDPAVLWKKAHRYTSQSNFVEELERRDQHKWHEWNLSLPLRAAVLLGAGASYPLGLPIGERLLDNLFACLRSMSGPEIEKTYAIAKAVRNKERRRRQWRGNVDISAEELIAGLEIRVSPERRRLTPRVPSNEYLQDLKYSEKEYIDAIDNIIRLPLEIMEIVDKHKLWYLLPLVSAGKKRTLTIASLNYDLAVEYACAIAGVPCSTGLEGWKCSGEFPKPNTGIELLKLHGSIDWDYSRWPVYQRGRIAEKHVTSKPFGKVSEGRFPNSIPAVIFGSGNKLTATGPFLLLLATFAQRLEEHDLLLVCGYSFQDTHVNEILRQWFNRKPHRRMISIEAPGACQRDHWFAKQPSRYMQLSIGAEKALACLFASLH
jgi:hypothetical protein